MRITMLESTTVRRIEEQDQSDHFESGVEYDVEDSVGALLVREGWAAPIDGGDAGDLTRR